MRASRMTAAGILFLLLVLSMLPLLPAAAADAKLPDFERFDGTIDGFPLPLTGGPYLNEGGDYNDDGITDTISVTFEYSKGEDAQHAELDLGISYFPVTTYLYAGGLAELLDREKHYNAGESRQPSALDSLRENPKNRELLVEDGTADRFSNLWYLGGYSTYGAWWGQRLMAYRDNYFISITAVGPGWTSDSAFLAAFDLAEQYARDSIDGLAGGITLRHYHPFEYLKAGGSIELPPAGDLVATVTGENGKPVKNEYVAFYATGPALTAQLAIAGEVPRFETAAVLGGDAAFLGSGITDGEGRATLNYLTPTLLIRGDAFARALLQESYMNEPGTLEGSFHAAVIDRATNTVTLRTSTAVSFNGVAKIVRITGAGRTEDFKEAYRKEYPDEPVWGPGPVRVKRQLAYPQTDYLPVETGFVLMPGDIVDIDGGVEVEIVWVTGDRAIARVPDRITYGDTEVRPTHSRLVITSSSYNSGFQTTWDKIESAAFGFSIEQGLDVLSGIHPVATGIKKGTEFTIDVYDAIREVNYTDQNLMIKIRLRSVVRVDATGETINVQTYEGSPDVLTASGGTATLGEREMVSVGADGTLSEVRVFNAKNDTPDWYETAAAWEGSDTGGTDSSGDGGGGLSMGVILGIVAVVLAGGGGFILLRRKK